MWFWIVRRTKMGKHEHFGVNLNDEELEFMLRRKDIERIYKAKGFDEILHLVFLREKGLKNELENCLERLERLK